VNVQRGTPTCRVTNVYSLTCTHSLAAPVRRSHRVKLATAGAFVSSDEVLIANARESLFARVNRNIREDGRTYDFDQRDALHYVVYDLQPLLMTGARGAPQAGAKIKAAH
jgi:hypothetical protein